MSTTTKTLINAAATAAFAIAAAATTVTNAFAQSTAPAATTGAATTGAAQTAVANGALASTKTQQASGLTRAQVQAEVVEARKNGTLLETEADFDVAQTKKHVVK
jgi:hypothetical protein